MSVRLFVVSPLALAGWFAFCGMQLGAQSVSPSISSSLADQSNTAGLDTNFSQGAELGQTSHTDVSDATASDLSAGAMSATVNSSAQSVSGNMFTAGAGERPGAASSGYGGGRAGAGASGFAVSGFGSTRGSAGDDGFGRSAGGEAFRTASLGRSAKRELDSQSTETGPGNGYAETTSTSGLSAEDPVLASPSGENVLEVPILGAISPTAEAESYFMSAEPVQKQYQFDDGVTPEFYNPASPGRLLPTSDNSSAPLNGFPDSTIGQAGLPLDTAEERAPGGNTASMTTAFPPVSEGTVFGIKGGVSRNLFAAPRSPKPAALRAQQDKLFLTRIMNGMNVSDAEAKRAQALEQLRIHPDDRVHGLKNPLATQQGDAGIDDTPASTTIR
jgi:hypothetical protein